MSMLSKFARFSLLDAATPIQHLPRLSKLLKGPQIYVKRDDLNVLGGGGNKLRKLEFFLGDALSKNADTIVTVGATQSNHARLTAAASAKAGLACELILSHKVARDDADYLNNGNILLDELFGAHIHRLSKEMDQALFVSQLCSGLKEQGKTPYFVPMGGSDAMGTLGYVKCAEEIIAYSQATRLQFSHVAVVNGSSSTHAGLIAGFKAYNYTTTTTGYNVVKFAAESLPGTLDLVNQALQLFKPELAVVANEIIMDDNYLGDGYGIPSSAMQEAVYLMAQTEGLLLDPVYTGKAFAGVVADIRSGKLKSTDNILFIMTGGAPGLYAYRSVFA